MCFQAQLPLPSSNPNCFNFNLRQKSLFPHDREQWPKWCCLKASFRKAASPFHRRNNLKITHALENLEALTKETPSSRPPRSEASFSAQKTGCSAEDAEDAEDVPSHQDRSIWLLLLSSIHRAGVAAGTYSQFGWTWQATAQSHAEGNRQRFKFVVVGSSDSCVYPISTT